MTELVDNIFLQAIFLSSWFKVDFVLNDNTVIVAHFPNGFHSNFVSRDVNFFRVKKLSYKEERKSTYSKWILKLSKHCQTASSRNNIMIADFIELAIQL